MPDYRIISEADTRSALRTFRGTRLRDDQQRQMVVVSAGSLLEAAQQAPTDRRAISIEELRPGPTYSDEELTAALTSLTSEYSYFVHVDPADFEDEGSPLVDSGTFLETVRDVAEALRDNELVPGLELSLLADPDFVVDYAMVEIYDDVRGVYLSHGCEVHRLIDDQKAAGWKGVLSIARALLNITSDLH